MQGLRALFSSVSGQFLRETLVRTLRGSLLAGGAMLLIASTGPWHYLLNSFNAHDMRRIAAWQPAQATAPKVVVVAITDAAYTNYFGGNSPLAQVPLLHLLQAIDLGATTAQGIVVDLDAAPTPAGERQALLQYFAQAPARWTLAHPLVGKQASSPARARWQSALCQLGVRQGLPYLPTEFGYVLSTHQLRGALAETALRGWTGCVKEPGESALLLRRPAPLSPSYVQSGVVLPFDGDLQQLQQSLTALQPQWVVLGGMWGTEDLINTPFGERYGVQLHAAALDGQLNALHQAPALLQMVVAWLALALITVLVNAVFRWIEALAHPWQELPGHQFMLQRAWPFLLMALVFYGVLGISELLAIFCAYRQLWLPSACVASVVIASVLFVWNWGLNKAHHFDHPRSAWETIVWVPMQRDWGSACHMCALLRARYQTTSSTADPTAMATARVFVELMLAIASLSAQTLLPLLSFVFAAHQADT